MSSTDSSAEPTPPPARRVWLQPRLFVSVVLVLLLWPGLMVFPGCIDATLDGSWPGVLQYAHEHGWQFGREIVFTWGPWGFLSNYVHMGETGATTKLLWETLGKLGIAVALVLLTRRLHVVNQVLFTLAFICVTWLFLDTVFLLLITLIVLEALMRRETPRWELVLWMLVLGFLGQIKFTYTLFAFAGIAAACGLHTIRREWKTAALLAAGFPAVYVLLWLFAGQNPDNLYPYFKLSLEFSTGYADAMILSETLPVFLWGASLAVTCGVFVVLLWRRHPDRAFGFFAAAYLALTWYVVWKHGYVRADGHVYGFFNYSLLLALVLPPLCLPGQRWHWFYATAVLGISCIEIFEPGLPVRCPQVAWARFKENYTTLFHIRSLPARWKQDYAQAVQTANRPDLQKEVGSATIDIFNYDQGIALLNNLNYRPRPIFQSYSAYTPKLEARNFKFYQSPRAPRFVLWKQTSIDGRFPTTDDAPLIPELPRIYQPVLDDGEHLLLKRRDDAPTGRLERKLLLTRSLRLGETLELPPSFEQALWLQARLPLNKLGKLRALLYKPPLIHLVVKDDNGAVSVWRLLPRIAEDGFLLSPLLESQADFASFMRGHGRRWIRSLRLEAPRYEREFWARIWDCAEIRLYALPALKIDSGQPLSEWVEEGITNLAPVSAQSGIPPESFPTGTTRAIFLHAPGSLNFVLPDNLARVSGTFGLRDGAFQGENQTNGVDLVVEQTNADGITTILLKRAIHPLQNVQDRGPQKFTVTLPPAPGRRLTLRILPGDNDDSRWDWSYLANLKFSPSTEP